MQWDRWNTLKLEPFATGPYDPTLYLLHVLKIITYILVEKL
jgi:hypothetical protein